MSSQYTDFITRLRRYEGASVFATEADDLHLAADVLLFGEENDEALIAAEKTLQVIETSGRLSTETVGALRDELKRITPIKSMALAA